MLRDCVRRECEERYELTESLTQAKTELLSLQRFENTKSLKNNLVPTPPSNSHGRQSSVSSSSDENVQQSLTKVTPALKKSVEGSITSSRSEKEQWFDNAIGKYSKNKLRISLKNNRK